MKRYISVVKNGQRTSNLGSSVYLGGSDITIIAWTTILYHVFCHRLLWR